MSLRGTFTEKLTKLSEDARKRFPDFEYDVEQEAQTYEAYIERIMPFVGDTVDFVNNSYDEGKRILIEGGQATLLDIDFGTYPFVTSSNPSIGGVTSGLGLAPTKIKAVIGVTKAYTTRVGAGPYPTELFGDFAEELRAIGHEYGTTTGRPRRVGWLDMVALKFSVRLCVYISGVMSCFPKITVLSCCHL